jgi:hypothetical protein
MSDLLPGITDGLKKAIWKVCIVHVCVRAHGRNVRATPILLWARRNMPVFSLFAISCAAGKSLGKVAGEREGHRE